MEGIPAVPAQPLSPNPRHGLGGDQLDARQVNVCPAGSHSCVEANAAGTCCPNDRYCYLNTNWEAKCCSLGVKCPDSKCGADQLYCNYTSSTTVALGTTSAGEQQGDMVTSIVSLFTSTACCNRPCNASSFSCEKAFGGQCCPYNFKCLEGGKLRARMVAGVAIWGRSAFSRASLPPPRRPYAPRIPRYQTAAAPAPLERREGWHRRGVAVGAAIIIAAVAWLCIRRRRQQRSGATGTASVSAHEMRFNTWAEHGAGGGARSGAGDQDQGDSLFVGPMTPWTPRSGFSDTNGAALAGHYIGPDAIDGPFTDRGGNGHMYESGLATTPPAVPGVPFGPDHIQRPVELGVGESQKDIEGQTDSEHVVDAKETPAHDEDPTAGPFELMGSIGTPSPLNSDELGQLTDKSPEKGPKQ
ncbi:hypothetical protein CIB48_g6702 [Xylaria polymorpha]|nr:hypothetical protein CIB48_g6702 [Xylaria polymorpha]